MLTKSDALKRYAKKIAVLAKKAPGHIRNDLRQELRLEVLIIHERSGGNINEHIINKRLDQKARRFIDRDLALSLETGEKLRIIPF